MDDLATNTTAISFRLTALAPELRNRTYELALRHDENDGIISPASSYGNSTETRAFIDGVWRGGKLDGATLGHDNGHIGRDIRLRILTEERSHLYITADTAALEIAAMTLAGQMSDQGPVQPLDHFTYNSGAAAIWVHVCSSLCLLQPALTRASRQLRQESLSFFYSANEFRILLPEPPTKKHVPMPLAWEFWRTVGDTHLRTVRLFDLQTPTGPCHFQVVHHQGECRVSFERNEPRMEDDAAKRHEVDARFVQWVEECHLCVQTVELAMVMFDLRWEPRVRIAAGITAEEQAAQTARWAENFTFCRMV